MTGIASLLAACMPADLRGTDHGRAVALWMADVGNAILRMAGGA